MTAAFLQAELSTLISDSKRKQAEIRAAAEKALAELKAISVTSETQLAADLSRRPLFIDPFILACRSKNAKLASTSTTCLQRLIASRAVAKEKLKDVLDAFSDVISTSYDVQLKILQTLPALLQLYAIELHGDLLARTLELCATLQLSKTPIVSKTASATFQQLVTTVFAHASNVTEKPKPRSGLGDDGGGGEDVNTAEDADQDAERLFIDFCAVLNRAHPTFLQTDNLSPVFTTQMMESIFESYGPYIKAHPKQLGACRQNLIPGLLRTLTSKEDVVTTSFALRTIYLMLRNFSELFQNELQQVLSYLISALDRDASPLWKRALCLEFFRSLCSDFALLRHTFVLFDEDPNSTNVTANFMASLVRLAAEDPALIGLGRQSTVPVQQTNDIRDDDLAAIEGQGVGGLASVNSADSNVTGVSTEWSVLSTPLIDLAESASLPSIPSTYLYSLVLGCISAFSDGLSKCIMPLSVSRRDAQESDVVLKDEDDEPSTQNEINVLKPRRQTIQVHKYQRLVNPLKASKPSQLAQAQTCSRMVEACWPAILATCSTFLNAALDSHFYHQLIRSVQKLTQVSGILELGTPRDALLTTLAKASVPANAAMMISMSGNNALSTKRDESISGADGGHEMRSPVQETPRHSVDLGRQVLNVRHLLCLRALLNLGIALGPSLNQDAWFIIIETLQQIEALMSMSLAKRSSSAAATPRIGVSQQVGETSLGAEMGAVSTATKRMFESTRSYDDGSFGSFVNALIKLMGEAQVLDENGSGGETAPSSNPPSDAISRKRSHLGSRSVSGLWTRTRSLDVEIAFVLAKIGDLARVNLHRFANEEARSTSWDLIVSKLLEVSADSDIEDELRLRSAGLVDLIAMEVVKLLDMETQSVEEINFLQCQCLTVLLAQTGPGKRESSQDHSREHIEVEIHKRTLEALEDILSHSGESLTKGWHLVFQILNLTFQNSNSAMLKLHVEDQGSKGALAAIIPVAFRCVQLISADFLAILEAESLDQLTSLMFHFGAQQDNVNMSLTTTTLLRSITSLVDERVEEINLTSADVFSTPSPQANASLIEDKNVYIWVLALRQLIRMCSDQRRDVRDATVRVLLQALKAASELISPRAWQVILEAAPFSILERYLSKIQELGSTSAEYLASFAYLTEGTTSLFTDNVDAIAADREFNATWTRYVGIIEQAANNAQISSTELAFSNLSRLLNTLSRLKLDHSQLIDPCLRLWTRQTAGRDPDVTDSSSSQSILEPNQAALKARASMLVEAYRSSPEAIRSFTHEGQHISRYLVHSIRETILTALHPPYTSDVKNLAPEQVEAVQLLSILKSLMAERLDNFAAVLLDLLRSTMSLDSKSRDDARPVTQTQTSKKTQQPTFIAFASSCLDLLRQLVEETRTDDKDDLVLHLLRSLETLCEMIKTKYTSIPMNQDAPLWRNATVTAVSIVKGSRKCDIDELEIGPEGLETIGASIILTASSILGAGGLESKSTSPPDDTIRSDEDFDVTHFRRFHTAAMPLLHSARINEGTRKQYLIALFNASLLTKPWFFDFPNDISSQPLESFNTVRPGSVHKPVFPRRRQIPYAATDALFDIVRQDITSANPENHSSKSVSGSGSSSSLRMARTAAPYLLLRIAHPLKTFLADQPLRSLTPHPMPQQREMEHVLTKSLELKCYDSAIESCLFNAAATRREERSPDINDDGENEDDSAKEPESKSGEGGDGKAHLRALYPLVLRVMRLWRVTPRLKGRMAWQADVPGREIERMLEEWIDVIGQGKGWGVDLLTH